MSADGCLAGRDLDNDHAGFRERDLGHHLPGPVHDGCRPVPDMGIPTFPVTSADTSHVPVSLTRAARIWLCRGFQVSATWRLIMFWAGTVPAYEIGFSAPRGWRSHRLQVASVDVMLAVNAVVALRVPGGEMLSRRPHIAWAAPGPPQLLFR